MSDNQNKRRAIGVAAGSAARFLAAAARRFHDDRGMQTAGSLTFTTLLSLVPMLAVALSLSTAFPVFAKATDALQLYLIEHFLPDAKGVGVLAAQIAAFAAKAERLTAVGLAFLAVTALMLMLTIDHALNRIFRVQRARPLAQRLLMYWAVLTLGPILIGTSVSITSYLVGNTLGLLDMKEETRTILGAVSFVFTCAALTMLYAVVPYRRIALRHALVGGLVAGIAFELAKRAFGLYVAKFPTYTLIYGAFAAFPVFLAWLYVSWIVVLAGATIVALAPAYGGTDDDRRRLPGGDFFDTVAVLVALARAQESGRALAVGRLAAETGRLPDVCERVLERCAALGWVARTEKDAWVLARSAASIRVADLYRAFVLHAGARAETGAPLSSALERHMRHIEDDLAPTLADLEARDRAISTVSRRTA
jgi:membrane protein